MVFDVGASGRSDSDESVIAPVLVIPDEVEARRRCAKSGMFRLLTSLYSVPAS